MGHLRSLPRSDILLAGVLAAFGVAEAAAVGDTGARLIWVLGMTVPLAWRRRALPAVVPWCLAVLLLPGVVGAGVEETVLPLPVMVVLGYTVGREARTTREAVLGVLAIVALVVTAGAITSAAAENSAAQDFVALVVIVGGFAAAGRLVGLRHGENVELKRLSAQLASEQEALAEAAVAEERVRMARELHDIIAHSVSLIAVQAAAADELLGRDEERARSAIRAVQDTARGAMSEMRRLLSVLRVDDARPSWSPSPAWRRCRLWSSRCAPAACR